MARQAFFNEGDWSQLFASLYFQQQRDIDALVQRAERRAESEQAADDADMYDRWRKGEVSDDEWLNYIRQRIEEEAHDPEEQAEWKKTLREHEEAIEDNKAEFAYQNGGSIHQLIAYYEQKLGGLDPKSQRYREVVLRLNDLKDKRDAESLETGAEEILNRIDRGQASLDDLLKFYRSHLRKLRPNSDIYKQVQDEIEKVSDEKFERQLGAELEKIQYQFNAGTISGSTAGAAIRRIAERYKVSDPQRYYEFLNAAVQYERAGGVVGGGGGGGGGGRRSGGGGGGTTTGDSGPATRGPWRGGFATQADINATRAALNRIEAFNRQIEAGALEVIDIETNRVVPVTDQFLRDLDQEALRLYDQLNKQYLGFVDTRGRHIPKEKEASEALEDRSNYIVRYAQPHNAIPVQRQAAAMLQDTERVLQQALNTTDPLDAERLVEREARRWRRFVDNVNTVEVQRPKNVHPQHLPPGTRRSAPPEGRIPDPLFAELASMPELFEKLLSTEDPAAAGPVVDQIMAQWQGSGFFDAQLAEQLATAILDVRQRRVGFERGELTWGVAPDAAGNLHVTTVPLREVMGQPTLDERGNVVVQRHRIPDVDYSSLGEDVQITQIYLDINGRPTPVLAPMVPAQLNVNSLYLSEDLDLPDGSVIKAGPINEREWHKLDQAFRQGSVGGVQVLKSNRKITEQPGLESWYQVLVPAYTDERGRRHKAQTWAFMPGVGWFRGSLPLRGVQRNPDGSLKLDDNGNPMIDRRGFSDRGAAPIPYEGFNPHEMQRIWAELVASGKAPQFYKVGPDGSLTEEPADFSDAYWDPRDAKWLELYQRTRDTWWDPFHRQRRMERERRDFERTLARDRDENSIFLRKRGVAIAGRGDTLAPVRAVAEMIGVKLPKAVREFDAPAIRVREPAKARLPATATTKAKVPVPKIQLPIPEREQETRRHWVMSPPPPPPPRGKTMTPPRPKTTSSTGRSGTTAAHI